MSGNIDQIIRIPPFRRFMEHDHRHLFLLLWQHLVVLLV
jgi:hypothetical protein